jgi:hypothetical protein
LSEPVVVIGETDLRVDAVDTMAELASGPVPTGLSSGRTAGWGGSHASSRLRTLEPRIT